MMNIWKILSTVSIVLAISCWFVLAILGFTGNLESGGSFSPWIFVCFIGFAFFAVLSGVFGKIGKKMSPLDENVGSSKGIDSLTSMGNSQATDAAPKVEVKVRCKSCGMLNDEDASYCKHCGAHL